MNYTADAIYWYSQHSFLDYGLDAPDDVCDYFYMEQYIQNYLIPVKLLTTTLKHEELNFDLMMSNSEESLTYLENLPVYMSAKDFSDYMLEKTGTCCWRHCLPDLVKAYSMSSATDWRGKIHDAYLSVFSNYSIQLVAFDLDGRSMNIYLHTITNTPVGDYPTELVVLPSTVNAAAGELTLRDLASTDPADLVDANRRVLMKAVEASIIDRDALRKVKYSVPVGRELKELELDALSPLLPPARVFADMRLLSDKEIRESGDPYHAVFKVVSKRPEWLIDLTEKEYFESISEFLGESSLEVPTSVCHVDDIVPWSEPPQPAVSIEMFDTETVISEAAKRLGVSVEQLNSVAFGLSEKDVVDFVSQFTGHEYKSLSEMLRPIDKDAVEEYIKANYEVPMSSLDDLVNSATRELDESDILSWIKDFTGHSYASVTDLMTYASDDKVVGILHNISVYIRDTLSKDDSVHTAAGLRRLADIAATVAVSTDAGMGTKLAFDMKLNLIDTEVPEYSEVARRFVQEYYDAVSS